MSKNNGRSNERKFVFDVNKMFLKLVDSQGRSKTEAFEEILQNAVDSEAGNIIIVINDRGAYFVDDGIGMDMETITKYFEVIGSSSKFDDKKKIGKHGIGFLKFMKYGKIYVRTQDYLLIIDVEKQGRDYRIIKCKHYYDGTAVTLKYYTKYVNKYDWDLRQQVRNVRHLVLWNKNRNIVINGSTIEKDIIPYTKVKHDDFEAFKMVDGVSCLYSQDLLVDNDFGIVGGFSVNCKKKMPLDFGRKGVVDSSEKDDLTKFISAVENSYIINRHRFSKEIGLTLKNRILDGSIKVEMIEDKQIFRTSSGSPISLTEISRAGEIYFASEGDRLGDLALVKGYLVIDSEFKDVIRDNIALRPDYSHLAPKIRSQLPSEVLNTEKDKVLENIFEEISAKLHKIYVYGMQVMHKELFYDFGLRKLKFGESKNRDAWTDGKTYVVLNKKFISKRETFEKICSQVYITLCHEYAHEDASIEDDRHTPDFYERFHDIVDKTAGSFGEWVGGNRYNKIAKLAENDEII